ncbi:LacI family transcriptional regulator [Klebsiella sp. RIT-PI-d]|uniref:LacI family DNA-binding transcriptional regulator n=1 Tax=Klebsiella sp. RIT-PI-d TaxID=1681196 RepID=UPI00067608B4|nr:LacI family DNA-binding transcriptional regulator [Klebsiella sp. RIT-PI-d]KNC06084.1 LacI family transcriptional regulator [Klebsiella sp. RIT-PI-d]
MKKKEKITMNDIARDAGVSQATVSLILNNAQSSKLSEETRQRVIQTAQKLGYKKIAPPHQSEGQEEIALLINAMPGYDPFTEAFNQARDAAWRNNTLLTIYDYGDDNQLAIHIIRQLEQRRCAGIILASPITRAIDFAPFENCIRIPLILLNVYDRHYPMVPTFLPNDYANAFQITRHLIAQGATRIAHITGDRWMDASRHRQEGYCAALSQAGLPCDATLIRHTQWQLNESYQATCQLMQSAAPPDAIFCASDWIALGCYQALAELQISIPQQVMVAGYDDQHYTTQLTPPLTSIQLPYAELSRLAVEYLCEGEDAATQVIMTGKLRIRASTQR